MFENMIKYYMRRKDGPLPPMQAKAYEYWLASNGLFLRAENAHVHALIRIAPVQVRGLQPLMHQVRLKRGRIPGTLLSTLVRDMASRQGEQMYYVTVTEEERYRLMRPPQVGNAASVVYDSAGYQPAILDVHSHANMRAFFSATDHADDVGFRFYGVIGNVYKAPEMRLRLGVHGYWAPVPVATLFSNADAVLDLHGKNNNGG